MLGLCGGKINVLVSFYAWLALAILLIFSIDFLAFCAAVDQRCPGTWQARPTLRLTGVQTNLFLVDARLLLC